jgi:hypothetical protein
MTEHTDGSGTAAPRGRRGGALVLELDESSLERSRRSVAPWLLTTSTLQAGFRKLAGRTTGQVTDPLVRDWLTGVERLARQHEEAVAELYAAFEVPRTPPSLLPTLAGTVVAGTRGLVGQVQGVLAGARGAAAWRSLRQLQLSNLDSMSAFGVVQQFGIALGRPRVVEITFPIVTKKSEQQLLLHELFLEFATDAVLTTSDI